jgi:hypothetical protein
MIEDTFELQEVLLNDVVDDFSTLSGLPEPAQGPRRRSVIRAVFAAIEGHIWAMKQRLLAFGEPTLSAAEVALLREVQYSIDDKGNGVEKAALLTFKQNIKFVIAVVKRLNPATQVDLGDGGWQALTDALDVRHRLTHPKSASDLQVSQDELVAAVRGLAWFMQLTHKGRDAMVAFAQTSAGHSHLMATVLREYVDKGTARTAPQDQSVKR